MARTNLLGAEDVLERKCLSTESLPQGSKKYSRGLVLRLSTSQLEQANALWSAKCRNAQSLPMSPDLIVANVVLYLKTFKL